jgi:hypothetical protein
MTFNFLYREQNGTVFASSPEGVVKKYNKMKKISTIIVLLLGIAVTLIAQTEPSSGKAGKNKIWDIVRPNQKTIAGYIDTVSKQKRVPSDRKGGESDSIESIKQECVHDLITIQSGNYERENCVVLAEVSRLQFPAASVVLYEQTPNGSKETASQLYLAKGKKPVLFWIFNGKTPAGTVRTFITASKTADAPAKATMDVEDTQGSRIDN